LVLPSDPARRVLRKLDVVGRVSVDEVVRLEVYLLDITGHENPARESFTIFRQVAPVADADARPNGTLKAPRRSNRHSPLRPVAVEVEEQRDGLAPAGVPIGNEFIARFRSEMLP
jgi:hypothetical protein